MEEDDDLEHDEHQPDQVDQHPTMTPASGSPVDRSETRLPPASPSPSPAPKLHREQEVKLWVCEFCGKEFSSGKALGCHKRIHSLKASGKSKLPQEPQEQERDRVKQKAICGKLAREEEKKLGSSSKTIEAGDVRVDNGRRPTCCVCGKDFRNKYSLFRHMRSHPDRGWRGIKPPSNSNCDAELKNRSCCSSDTSVSGATGSPEVDDDYICSNVAAKIGNDLEGSLPSGWSKKGKRGQIVPSDSSDSSELEAAEALLALCKRRDEELVDSGLGRYRSSKEPEKPDQESKSSNQEMACDLENNVKSGYGKVVGEVLSNQKVLKGYCSKLRDSESDRLMGLHKEEMLKELKNRLNVKKEIKMNPGGRPGDREGIPEIGSYDPREAKRELFPTSQALGGHKIKTGELADNSTLKDPFPIPNQKADLIPTVEANGEAIQNENNEDHTAPLAAMEATFHCENGSKTFQTGQALGGHKRCHLTAPLTKDSTPSGKAANNRTSAKESTKVTKVSHKRLDIDLNELPMPDGNQEGSDN